MLIRHSPRYSPIPKTIQEDYHDMLDQAFREVQEGESVLGVFISIVLKYIFREKSA